MDAPLYWHAYGGVVPEDHQWAGCFSTLIYGESTMTADEAKDHGAMVVRERYPWAEYLATFDHEPTEAEKEALQPESWRDSDVESYIVEQVRRDEP